MNVRQEARPDPSFADVGNESGLTVSRISRIVKAENER
jgi:hypothetical protein